MRSYKSEIGPPPNRKDILRRKGKFRHRTDTKKITPMQRQCPSLPFVCCDKLLAKVIFVCVGGEVLGCGYLVYKLQFLKEY